MALNENSPAIFQMGANLVTSALPEEHKADMQMLGKGVSQILRNRFLTQQAEDFKANELAAFQQASADFGTNLSMIEDPNQQVQALMDYKNSVMLPFITNTSLKYANNETIMNTAKTVFQMGPQLKDYLDAGNMQNQTAQVGIDQQNADTARMNAGTNEKEAATRAAALRLEMEQKAFIDPNAPSSEIEKQLRNMSGPERQALDTEALDIASRAYVSAQGTQYDPQRDTQWSASTYSTQDPQGNVVVEGDLDRAKSILATNGKLKDRIEFVHRGISRLGIDKFKEKFPNQFSDVLPYFTGAVEKGPSIQMKGNVKDNFIVGVFKNQVVHPEVTADQYVEEIKSARRPEELGDRFYSAMESAIKREPGGVLFLGGTRDRLEFDPLDWKSNRAKLTKILQAQLKTQILDEIVSDDTSSVTTRRKLQKILDTALEKFIGDYAAERGILVEAPKPSGSRREIKTGILPMTNPQSTGGIF